MSYHRTTIDIDLDAYDRARSALGTRGFKDTVNAALERVGRQALLERAAERVRQGRFSAPTPEELDQLRRVRTDSDR
ncbi:MAG: hypothetical protein KJ051_07975 [Thermoleophilia bacterium]|nr:hypothetical protein [Thermoleophilia bacterium]